ncbi:MAG: 1,4-dihydroxy-6-naphthoate synthase [Marinilabiliales bacterium]
MKIKLAFSSCPNDTYMFAAIANKNINLHGIDFDIHIADIEELNKMCIAGENDVSKISISAFSKIWDSYKILKSGCAIGDDNGPLVISKSKIYPDELQYAKIAIPGFNTTANMLLDIIYPGIKQKFEYLFSDIIEAVISNETDAGLIIHETRFTYEKKGLRKVADLGQEWKSRTGLLIPLGAIAIKDSLPADIKNTISNILYNSILFAIENPVINYDFIKNLSNEKSDEIIYKHIQLYVNDLSIELDYTGKKSIEMFYQNAYKNKLTSQPPKNIFWECELVKD